MTYIVNVNDTLNSIASAYGVSVAALTAANQAAYPNLATTQMVQQGMVLTIPAGGPTGPNTAGVTLPQAPGVVSTNPPAGSLVTASSKLPVILAAGALIYLFLGRKKGSAPVAQNPRRCKRRR